MEYKLQINPTVDVTVFSAIIWTLISKRQCTSVMIICIKRSSSPVRDFSLQLPMPVIGSKNPTL
uniref:Mitochondrial carrier protein n=1 Tax=Solanum tuberosum TaxID=4113 RepID=M0ZJK4_SOLTU